MPQKVHKKVDKLNMDDMPYSYSYLHAYNDRPGTSVSNPVYTVAKCVYNSDEDISWDEAIKMCSSRRRNNITDNDRRVVEKLYELDKENPGHIGNAITSLYRAMKSNYEDYMRPKSICARIGLFVHKNNTEITVRDGHYEDLNMYITDSLAEEILNAVSVDMEELEEETEVSDKEEEDEMENPREADWI